MTAPLLAALALLARAEPARVSFPSLDGTPLAAEYRPPQEGKPALVLLHGARSARGEWRPLCERLEAMGWGSLALDARGHGESGGPKVSDAWGPREWGRIALDLEAAARFVERSGVPARRVGLCGASIGANLAALAAAARTPQAPFLVLLSPGLGDRGVARALARFEGPVLLAAAPDDPAALRGSRVLFSSARNPARRLLVARSGHGARMLEGEGNRAFVEALLGWLRDRVLP